MEPKRFLFKLTAIFLQYILLIIVFLPLVFLAQLLKYNFKMEEILFLKVLFLAIAFAMPFVVANAFAYANYEKMEIDYYLKPNQTHTVTVVGTPESVKATIEGNIQKLPLWVPIQNQSDLLGYKIKNLILNDTLTVSLKPKGETHTELIINSKPVVGFVFLDFARNYRNILTLLTASQPTN